MSEKKDNPPILIVDKKGLIGEGLAKVLSGDSPIVFVSQFPPKDSHNTLFVFFGKKFPTIPDNFYSNIFIIDYSNSLEDSISSFLKKAKNDKSELTIVTHRGSYDKFLKDEALEYKKLKIILFGDYFTEDGKAYPGSFVAKFISSASVFGRIEVPGDGTELTYPIFFDDLIAGILEVAFGTSNDRILFLYPRGGITFLSLAHLLQRLDPTIAIDFTKKKIIKEKEINLEGRYLLEEDYSLAEKIKKINLKSFQEEEEYSEAKKVPRNLMLLFFSIALFLLLPFLSTLFFYSFGNSFLTLSLKNLSNSNLNEAKSESYLAQKFFYLGTKTGNVLSLETQPFEIPAVNSLIKNVEKEKEISLGLNFLFNADSPQAIKEFLVFAQKENLQDKFLNSKLINFLSETIDVWANIFSQEGSKKYLILFQNEERIRPTGGRIEAYGILTLEKGKLKSFDVGDVKSADANLVGHVEPPFPVRRYLNSVNFFFKDSNFNVDFRDSASSSAFFIGLEKKTTVDGVFAIDLSFVKRFIKKTGPIFLSEKGKFVDSENLFNEAKSSDQLFFKDLLKQMEKKIQDKDNFLSLLTAVSESLLAKDVIFSFTDAVSQDIFSVNGYAGSLNGKRQNLNFKINDFLGINGANLGESKDLEIQRKVTKKTKISDTGEISSSLTLNYKDSTENDLKEYLRIILPQDAKILKIKIDGEDKDFQDAIVDPLVYEGQNFQSPTKLEVWKENLGTKTSFGFLNIVEKAKTKVINIDYSFSRNPSSQESYNLLVFKQPGISYPFEFSLELPTSYSVSSSPNFLGELNKDIFLNFNFFKK